jgi:hypothetical protein
MKKILGLLIIGLLLMPIEVKALTTIFYHRNDTQTINTVLGYILSDTQSSGEVNWSVQDDISGSVVNWDVYVLHSDGSETSLGNGIAEVNNPTVGYNSATWNCPVTSLASTDAIKIVGNIITDGDNASRTFVSSQLQWGNLNASTWTFYFYFSLTVFQQPPGLFHFINIVHHGDSTRNTRIEGINYSLGGSYAFIMD